MFRLQVFFCLNKKKVYLKNVFKHDIYLNFIFDNNLRDTTATKEFIRN